MPKFIEFSHITSGGKLEPVMLNLDHIIYAIPATGDRTEVRYMTYRLDVYYANMPFDSFKKLLNKEE